MTIGACSKDLPNLVRMVDVRFEGAVILAG